MENSKVSDMFDHIARRYDLLNHLLSLGIDRRWRRKLVRGAVSESPERVLDVATGTGDVAIAIGQALPNSQITGIDLSEGMLKIGRSKTVKRGVNVALNVDNGERLSFADSEFDAITIAFGIRNFSDRQAGLREFMRVLRTGGSVHILEFSTPRKGLFAQMYRLYFHTILPFVGRIISHDRHAYDYLPASVDGFPTPEKFTELMRKAGFAQCTAQKLTCGVAYIYTGIKR